MRFTALFTIASVLLSASATSVSSHESLSSLVSKRFLGHRQIHRARKTAELEVAPRGIPEEFVTPASANASVSFLTHADLIVVGKIQVFKNGDSLGYISRTFTPGSTVVSLVSSSSDGLIVRFVEDTSELRIWNSLEAVAYPVLGLASIGDKDVGRDIGEGSAQIGALTFTRKSNGPSKAGNYATKSSTNVESNVWVYNPDTNGLTATWSDDKVTFFLLQDHIFLTADVAATEKHYEQSIKSDILTFKLVQ